MWVEGSSMARLAKMESRQASRELHLASRVLMLDNHLIIIVVCLMLLPGWSGWALSK